MTVDEIKATYTMADILAKYGMRPNRSGFCKCPFHDEKTASMKIYKDSFYCFGCGAHGDIFTFVEKIDDLSFKDAFLSLGGTYEKEQSFSSKAAIYHAQKARAQKEKEEARAEREKQINIDLITFYRRVFDESEPLSDQWCSAYKALGKQLRRHSELNDIPY